MRIVQVVLLASLVAFAAGCSAVVRPAAPPGAPVDGQALVVFVGRALRALLYDISDGDTERFIGIVEPETKAAYLSPTGRRRFMVVGETADFLDADLLPGRTYHALVTGRPGWVAPRFSFRPVRRADVDAGRVATWIADAAWVEPNERGQRYAADHTRTVHDKKLGNLPKYEGKSAVDRDKVRLDPDDGI
jgi:hypothetical protein